MKVKNILTIILIIVGTILYVTDTYNVLFVLRIFLSICLSSRYFKTDSTISVIIGSTLSNIGPFLFLFLSTSSLEKPSSTA